MAGAATTRVTFAPVEGAAELFTGAFCDYLTLLHDGLAARARGLRAQRDEVLRRALQQRVLPAHPPASLATTGTWQVPPVPDDLRTPGIEISGPCSVTSMFINALNPGPEGERAAGDLDDDEDSGGHRLIDTVRAAYNRLAAVNRELAVALVKRLLQEELADILTRRPGHADVETRYRRALQIGLRWVKNYTELDFRSLGSSTRAELDAIAAAPDAF